MQTEILPEIEETTSDFDDQKHFVRIKQLIQGGPQVALCGKKWVPATTAPGDLDKLPMCAKCEELMGLLEAMNG